MDSKTIVLVPMCHLVKFSPANNVKRSLKMGRLLFWTDMVFDPEKVYHLGHLRLSDGSIESFFLENDEAIDGRLVKKLLPTEGFAAVESGRFGKFYFRKDAQVRLTPMRSGETIEARRYYLPGNSDSEPCEFWSVGVLLEESQLIP